MKLFFLRSVFVRGKHVEAGTVVDVSPEDAKILTIGNRPPCEVFDPENSAHKKAVEKNEEPPKTNIKPK